jgi:hypothetical protein
LGRRSGEQTLVALLLTSNANDFADAPGLQMVVLKLP